MAVYGEEETWSSPRNNHNHVKFLCSHGGKILPRPSDGQLKYVGGETRVIAVARNITFSDLMNKLASLFQNDVLLKYQSVREDLDALISVTCDEDLRHMLDEFHLHDAMRLREAGPKGARMRAFLFPSTPITIDTHISNDPNPNGDLHQHYIDAINGIMRTTSDLGPLNFTISSSGSSANSSSNGGVNGASDTLGRYHPNHELQRVHSSPNLLNSGPQQHIHYPRLKRPGAPLKTAQSDVARYNIDQMARRYYTPLQHHRESRELIGFGLADGQSVVYRGVGLGEGELPLKGSMKQRWGSPLKRSSSRQD